jgi:hypothetical protein
LTVFYSLTYKNRKGRAMRKYIRISGYLFLLLFVFFIISVYAQEKLTPQQQQWLKKSTKYEKNGWIYLTISGESYERGFQHGYNLSKEIEEALSVVKMTAKLMMNSEWENFSQQAYKLFWEKTPAEYQEEIKGIAEGASAVGVEIRIQDILGLNSVVDMMTYLQSVKSEEKNQKVEKEKSLIGCSAFIATGNATFDGRIVIAHNTWIPYFLGVKFNLILFIKPDKGNEIIMQSMPGLIHSMTDFYISSGGLMLTETTISNFEGFDINGIPEFVRIRNAAQYANSIDEFANIMREGNNGAYANDWLIGDIKSGEIACLELGLKHTPLYRTYDGYFVGSNVAIDRKLRTEEAKDDYSRVDRGNIARWARWQQLMRQYYGMINIPLAKQFLADHYDSYLEKYFPGPRSICGHYDLHGSELMGATDGKVSDSELGSRMMLWAKFGRPCHTPFIAEDFLKRNPDMIKIKDYIKDLPDLPWTLFQAK